MSRTSLVEVVMDIAQAQKKQAEIYHHHKESLKVPESPNKKKVKKIARFNMIENPKLWSVTNLL